MRARRPIPARRESDDTESAALRKSLKLLKEYLSVEKTCSACGEKITEKDDHTVVVVGIEWLGDSPTLLRRMTVCDICASDLPEYKLLNPLYRMKGSPLDGLPPELLPDLEQERADDLRGEVESAGRAREKTAARIGLQTEISVLEASLPRTAGTKGRAAIRRTLDTKREQLASDWNLIFTDDGTDSIRAASVGNHLDLDRTLRRRTSEADVPVTPDDQDQRRFVQRFLASPYASKLAKDLRPFAKLYARGFGEAEIGELLDVSQPTVSRRLQAVKTEAVRRR